MEWLLVAFFLILYLAVESKREHFVSGMCRRFLGDRICGILSPCNYIPRGFYLDWFRDWFCGEGGCPEGKIKQAGLCYEKCRDGFHDDGALMCWKNYPEFPGAGGGMLSTPTLTKSSKTVVGSVLDSCNEDEERSGALCYPKCKKGMKGEGPMCWNDIYGVGIGTLPG